MIIQPKNRKAFRHILAPEPRTQNEPTICTPAEWQKKRGVLSETLQALLGSPSQTIIPSPKFRVLHELQTPEYLQQLISYEAEPGEEVRAHLLIPPKEKRLLNHEDKAAAILCLHGTSPDAKNSQIGIGSKPNRDYGKYLAQEGFITLSPDHVCSGDRLPAGVKPYDTASFYERHPHWSAAGKAAWDGARALDILESLPEVDASRLGCVGHSLGGHGTMWTAAFDERVQASVYSCGLTTWQENPDRYHWSRDHWYIYIPKLRAIFQEQEKTGGLLPVEMHEFAALIAPRPFLHIGGMTDRTYDNNETLPEVGLQLNALWEVLGQPQQFANFLFGTGHDVPNYSRLLTLGWFQHHLTPRP